MASTIHVDVVSAEESIFSGEAKFVALPGEAGELGIYPRHTPLITRIKAGCGAHRDGRRHAKSSSSWPAASWKCSPTA
jgi:F0F1-type ATP synthase epsilon subunit